VDTILELAQLKGRGACRSLIVTGCLTQRYGTDVLREIPEVDGILGTSELHRVVDLVRQAAGRHDWATSAPPGYLYEAATPRVLAAQVPYAYVKIAEGCDMGCTFCAIPQFRGRHRSRPLGDIVREVEGLGARGIQEVVLVSQDTLAYGRDLPGNGDIGDLLLALGETRMPWIRPMTYPPTSKTGSWRSGRARGWCRTWTCRSSTPTTRSCAPCAAASPGCACARSSPPSARPFRPHRAYDRLLGFPGETEASVERLEFSMTFASIGDVHVLAGEGRRRHRSGHVSPDAAERPRAQEGQTASPGS
jgi:tRNA A37 methylthiotransferase MiaB